MARIPIPLFLTPTIYHYSMGNHGCRPCNQDQWTGSLPTAVLIAVAGGAGTCLFVSAIPRSGTFQPCFTASDPLRSTSRLPDTNTASLTTANHLETQPAFASRDYCASNPTFPFASSHSRYSCRKIAAASHGSSPRRGRSRAGKIASASWRTTPAAAPAAESSGWIAPCAPSASA